MEFLINWRGLLPEALKAANASREHFSIENEETNGNGNDFIAKLCDSMPREDFINAIMRSKIAAMIVQERAKRNMTREQFGGMIGVTADTISRWEDFDSDFRISTLVHICSILDVIPVLSFQEEEGNEQ